MTFHKQVELLAPAGNAESLRAAVYSGADAVYLGGKHLNARRSADNFDAQALQDACAFCHARNVKVYLTLNTLIFDDELPVFSRSLQEACEAGIDALIVQDLAAVSLVRRLAPSLPLHASTQMSIHNLEGAKLLEEIGFTRVVLARELSMGEIAEIRQGTHLDIECFVHGALCMSVSGQCTLSSMIGGRSGNRGLCAQPCRLPFACRAQSHALSLRDLSLVDHIPTLRQIGVHSLKIEGRMKRPEYVAAATTACRAALEGQPVDYDTLEAVFSRTGFTDGYFTGQRGGAMFGIRKKEDVTAASTAVFRKLQSLYRDEYRRVPVDFSLTAHLDEPLRLHLCDDAGNTVTVSGDPPQQAHTSPTTPEKAQSLLQKTGGTPFSCRNVHCDIGQGLLLPASQINALRRQALEHLLQQRSLPRPHLFDSIQAKILLQQQLHSRASSPPRLRIRLHQAGQLTPALAAQADEIVLPLFEYTALKADFLSTYAGKLLVELPAINFNNSDKILMKLQFVKKNGVFHALCGNLGSLGLAKQAGMIAHGDYGLNITNSISLEEYKQLGLVDATLSFELDHQRICRIGGELPRGILAYGFLPLMALRNCPVQASKGCKGCPGFPTLTDRTGRQFSISCNDQSATLHNCVPLSLSDRLPEWQGMDFLTLYFTHESPATCLQILTHYRQGTALEGEKTRGLYYRGVL